MAGIAAAEVDKLVETKGLDWIDRRKAQELAKKQAHELAEQRYQGGTGWEYAQGQGGYAQEYDFSGGVPYGARGHGSYEQYPQRGYVQEEFVEEDYSQGPRGYGQGREEVVYEERETYNNYGGSY